MEGVSRIIRKKCFDISVEEIKNILFDEVGVLSRVWFSVQGLLQLLIIKVAVEKPARVPIVVVEAYVVLKSEERKATVFFFLFCSSTFISLVG